MGKIIGITSARSIYDDIEVVKMVADHPELEELLPFIDPDLIDQAWEDLGPGCTGAELVDHYIELLPLEKLFGLLRYMDRHI